jgi:hypothetical protein
MEGLDGKKEGDGAPCFPRRFYVIMSSRSRRGKPVGASPRTSHEEEIE